VSVAGGKGNSLFLNGHEISVGEEKDGSKDNNGAGCRQYECT
jgi:hypothetical protein